MFEYMYRKTTKQAIMGLMLIMMIAIAWGMHPIVAHAATFVVNTTADTMDENLGDGACADSNGNCSLRAAIMQANALSGPDTITLPAGTYTLSGNANEDDCTSGDLDIADDLTINGAGADVTIIDANQVDRVFDVYAETANITVTINDVTITGGKAPDGPAGYGGDYGGGIYNNETLYLNNCVVKNNSSGNATTDANGSGADGGYGGGIYNAGTLMVNSCTISNNRTGAGAGQGGYGGDGGGIYNDGTLTVNNSTISGNTTGNGGTDGVSGGDGGSGAGIANANEAALTNTTISGNTTGQGGDQGGDGGDGGGIYNYSGTTSLTVNDCTITNNAVGNGGSGGVDGDGGGLYNDGGSVDIQNTILAGNADVGGEAPDCSGTITSQDYNLIGNNTGCTFASAGHDQVGTGTAPIDPKLGALADNGGPTYTHALQADSPAVDAIPTDSGQCTAGDRDQRYALRADGDERGGTACDIGAYELSNTFRQDITRPRTYFMHKARVQVTSLGSLSELTVQYVPQSHPNAPATLQTGQYWSFTPNDGASGFTLNMTLPLNQTPSTEDKVCYYTGVDQNWDCAADSVDTSKNTVTRNGITHFSDWAVEHTTPTAVTLRSLTGRSTGHSADKIVWPWGPLALAALYLMRGRKR
ncbi:MAG: CSLREA domain-containing protein [Anaerolineae bacterium]|nr:CSLREA domain-containing protein [Anaerolineae bacterium]